MFRSLLVATTLSLLPTCAALAQSEGPNPVSIIVRAAAKSTPAPPLHADNLTLEFNGKKVPVSTVQPLAVGTATGVHTEVALLIDDGLRAQFGTQISDIEGLVQHITSPTTALGVGYMRNGDVYFPAGFSTEPETEMKAIRLPIGTSGIDGSPYFCLQDLLKKWPVHPGVARVVLMISSGIDRYNGSVSPLNQDSPYVESAIKDAQKAKVPVYSIFYGRREVNSNLGSFSGQSYLAQMADATGGELFNQGTINPVSLTPFFNNFTQALHESYLVTFQTGSSKLEDVKVKSSLSGVKLRVQQIAGVDGAK